MSKESEVGNAVIAPKHWLDEYNRKRVVVQPKAPYFSVQSPGVLVPLDSSGDPIPFAKLPETSIAGFHQMPAIQGIAIVRRDECGNVILRMKSPDPGRGNGEMKIDLVPEAIDLITYYEENRIVEG